MKRRNPVPVGATVAAMLALAAGSTFAQDFTAGKTPAQLFGSDCAECHRSPAGLAKNRDLRALSGFLREHYTTKADSANSLAAYVSGFTGSAPPPESRRGAAAARRAGEPEDARTASATPAAKPADEQSARRRRPPGVSSEGEKHAGTRVPTNLGSRSAAGTRETAALPPSEKPLAPPSSQAAPEPAPGRSGDEATGEKRVSTVRTTAVEEPADIVERLKAYLISGQDLAAVAADSRRGEGTAVPGQTSIAPRASPGPAAPPANESPSVMLSPGASAMVPPAPAPADPAGASPEPVGSTPAPSSAAALTPAAPVRPAR